jgi:hypothetical protein
VNPSYACAEDGLFAEDRNSGTNTNSSCTDAGKDRHLFYNFSMSLPAGATIKGLEVGLNGLGDAWSYFCVDLSWNSGSAWTSLKTTASLSSSKEWYWLGGPTDTWGHVWNTATEINSGANFRLRVTSVTTVPNTTLALDAVALKVSYTQ